MYLGCGFVWECLQAIVVISTVIGKIYSIASSGCRHIAEPRKLLVSYFLLFLLWPCVNKLIHPILTTWPLFHLNSSIFGTLNTRSSRTSDFSSRFARNLARSDGISPNLGWIWWDLAAFQSILVIIEFTRNWPPPAGNPNRRTLYCYRSVAGWKTTHPILYGSISGWTKTRPAWPMDNPT